MSAGVQTGSLDYVVMARNAPPSPPDRESAGPSQPPTVGALDRLPEESLRSVCATH
jgi:hypothetical protein